MYDPETGSIREPVTILGVLPNQGHVEVRHSDGSISVYTGFDQPTLDILRGSIGQAFTLVYKSSWCPTHRVGVTRVHELTLEPYP